ncbi:MAG: molybdenum cofactor guanylyltransferase [Myxococcota bacterium]
MSEASARWAGVSVALLCRDTPDIVPTEWISRLFEDVIGVGRSSDASFPGRCVPDVSGPACPLRGLLGGLDAAREERVLVLGGRHVAPSPELVLALLAAPDADAVVPRSAGGVEPLCALYRRDPVRARARARLEKEPLALSTFLGELDVWHLEGEAIDSLRTAAPSPLAPETA